MNAEAPVFSPTPSAASLREIPYNYTSFSDREICLRYLAEEGWNLICQLRDQRQTGQSARMLFEVLGDMWAIDRNPYIQDDLLGNPKRRDALVSALRHRIEQIRGRSISSNLTGNDDGKDAIDVSDSVSTLLEMASEAVDQFELRLQRMRKQRNRIRRSLRKHTHSDNIRFDGLSRVSHVTDATDWRVELPVAVLTPDSEQELPALIKACVDLDVCIVPRGGGTGYTGGAIPLRDNAVVINLEKLQGIAPVLHPDSTDAPCSSFATVAVGAGTVTRRVSEAADQAGLVFAVDPTSWDASTIGGNIAMNAGGKKAVLWGTTIDNLLSWRMVDAAGDWLDVQRLDPNGKKLHTLDKVRFKVSKSDGLTGKAIGEDRILEFAGAALRHQGLGKDVTDKFLGGLPGVQKEGCDGLISSAVFILHKMPAFKRTVCMEFYGNDLRKAVSAIVDVNQYIDQQTGVQLAGLEHLDDRYIKAVSYSAKAARGELPRMLLLADLVSDDENLLGTVTSGVVQRTNQRGGEGFVAVSAKARAEFWAARSRTAAIAAHTNAFKINEDVVIPLPRLADYSEGIELINIEHSLGNKLTMLDGALELLQQKQDSKAFKVTLAEPNADESAVLFEAALTAAMADLRNVRADWQQLLTAVTDSYADYQQTLNNGDELQSFEGITAALLNRERVVSYRAEVERPLKQRFQGKRFADLRKALDDIHTKHRSGRLFVALHMHAGDGNIHTNIPVNSNDYVMLKQAEGIVDRVMELARSLNGVISGEHGIGLTKLQYMQESELQPFADYKNEVDPDHRFNPGKLLAGSDLSNAYTPSLRLVQQEAIILEQSELGSLNDSIKDCLRCGKCKPVCATHSPGANLLYSPRNKVLGTGLIIEAFLYEEQTRRGVSINHFDEMNDIADHCTVCHKCLAPCPVDIDFGDVSMNLRRILRAQGKKKFSPGTATSMAFLNAKDPRAIKVMRKTMIEWGFGAQRMANDVAMKFAKPKQLRAQPQSTTGATKPVEQVIHFVNRKLPGKKLLPAKTTRALLGVENAQYVPIIRDHRKTTDEDDAVFYFPGCGSERLFSQVGLATIAMLFDSGSKTVLPPGYLCCGYPQASVGDESKSKQITAENRVLFHRIANTLNYLDIKTVVVSCGTCMDQLLKYEFERIFPGCRLVDIHEYLMEKGYKLDGVTGVQYLYHDPCHSPMKTYDPMSVSKELLGDSVTLSDRCCGESGTFAVSRPDIANQVRSRKLQELNQSVATIASDNQSAAAPEVKLMTSCPACVQGLSRYEDETGIETDYIVVEIVKTLFGEDWAETFLDKVHDGGIEQVLL